jgi:circadian clock protein KaiB
VSTHAPVLNLRLYVAGDSPNSQMAVQRLRAFCDAHCPTKPTIEVIDVLRAPAKALEDAVILTPTLVRLDPAPVRRIVGNLSVESTLAHALGVEL